MGGCYVGSGEEGHDVVMGLGEGGGWGSYQGLGAGGRVVLSGVVGGRGECGGVGWGGAVFDTSIHVVRGRRGGGIHIQERIARDREPN